MSLAGHQVSLFEFQRFHADIAAIFETCSIEISGTALTGNARLCRTTHDIGEAIEDTELILIFFPSLAHAAYAEALAGHLQDGHHVVLVPGTFGSLEFVKDVRSRGCKADFTVSELNTLPYASRVHGPQSVHIYHEKPVVGIGVFPAVRTDEVFNIFKDLYSGTYRFRDVLEAGLTNVNPIIHPLGVLMNAGRIEYARGQFWYYEEGITASTARAMEKLDDERLAVGLKLGLKMPRQSEYLHAVKYGPKGDLWEALKGSKSLTQIKGPSTVVNRYVTEDIPIGLVCWSQLGQMLGAPTPLMQATVELGIAVSGVNYWETGRTLQRCGIDGMKAEQLCEYARSGCRT
jgi:opine dehydrogenase